LEKQTNSACHQAEAKDRGLLLAKESRKIPGESSLSPGIIHRGFSPDALHPGWRFSAAGQMHNGTKQYPLTRVREIISLARGLGPRSPPSFPADLKCSFPSIGLLPRFENRPNKTPGSGRPADFSKNALEGPLSTTLPSAMNRTLLLTFRAKSISWVTTSMVMPSSRQLAHEGQHFPDQLSGPRRRWVREIDDFRAGSQPAAMATRCCWPPESWEG
jgi:hypothetical protein